jgi:uncharacterized protein YcaQ
VTRLSLRDARRIALAAAGFADPRPARPGIAHVRRAIHRLGLLQLDFVNVVSPSHYLVMYTRLGPYRRQLLDELVYRRREFVEHWAREASIVPMELWPALAYRRESYRVRPWGFDRYIADNPEYVDGVLDEIRRRGPLSAAEVAPPPDIDRRIEGSWYSAPRAVLESHFGAGRLAAASRGAGFARVFDLTERVVPAALREQRVDPVDARRELIRRAARAMGVAAAADLADYWRMPMPQARAAVASLVTGGELVEVAVEGWKQTAYLDARAPAPRAIDAEALLSPFDPLVWYRPRLERLFGFEYRLEVFVPAARRRWGFYVLPFLMGERLVARVDLKVDRAGKKLVVLSEYVEGHAPRGRTREALRRELGTLARWCETALQDGGDPRRSG